MPKFKVLVQKYVEETAVVEIEAETAAQAAELYNAEPYDYETKWEPGDDEERPEAYAVKQGDELIWER
jgi:hypothetical protein